ncbi:unnamed protein product [Ixodes hexagonus]
MSASAARDASVAASVAATMAAMAAMRAPIPTSAPVSTTAAPIRNSTAPAGARAISSPTTTVSAASTPVTMTTTSVTSASSTVTQTTASGLPVTTSSVTASADTATTSAVGSDANASAKPPRAPSPLRYQTVFKNVIFGRRAREIVLNVYCWLRLEYPNASYNEIVKQATLLTGVAPVTIYRWKKCVNMYDPDEMPVRKRRRKNAASSTSPNGVKKVRKSRPRQKKPVAEQPSEQGGTASAHNQTGNPTEQPPKKRQRKKQPARVGKQADQQAAKAVGATPAVQAAQAVKNPRKKAVPPVRCEPPSNYVTPPPVQPSHAHAHYEHRQFTRLEPRIPNPNQMHHGQGTAQSFDPPTSNNYQSWWSYH